MQVITYPHPTLRRVSKPVRKVDAELKAIVRQMFDLMYEHQGIGLAANQVDLPLRLFVMNLKGKPGEGEELVFLNPVLSRHKGSDVAEEGCLSIPSVYGDVIRPKQVRVEAFGIDGSEILLDLTGLAARCVQHETDHLDGILFPDRMTDSGRKDIDNELYEFEIEFQNKRGTGEIPDDAKLAAQWQSWEAKYA